MRISSKLLWSFGPGRLPTGSPIGNVTQSWTLIRLDITGSIVLKSHSTIGSTFTQWPYSNGHGVLLIRFVRIQCAILSVNKMKYRSVTIQIGETQSLTHERDYESVKRKLDCFYFNLGLNLVGKLVELRRFSIIMRQTVHRYHQTCNNWSSMAKSSLFFITSKMSLRIIIGDHAFSKISKKQSTENARPFIIRAFTSFKHNKTFYLSSLAATTKKKK